MVVNKNKGVQRIGSKASSIPDVGSNGMQFIPGEISAHIHLIRAWMEPWDELRHGVRWEDSENIGE
jgi:hypothetical protein